MISAQTNADLTVRIDVSPAPRVIRISALTGSGFDELVENISILAASFQTDSGSDLIAINARHATALIEA